MAFPSSMVKFDGHPIAGDGSEPGISDHLERRNRIDGVIEVGDGPIPGQMGQGVASEELGCPKKGQQCRSGGHGQIAYFKCIFDQISCQTERGKDTKGNLAVAGLADNGTEPGRVGGHPGQKIRRQTTSPQG